MKRNVNNKPIDGTVDVFGAELRKIDFLFRKFTDVINRYGYEQLEVPLIERASSFAEEIVGHSPWPEWDKRGCFYLRVNNYTDSFNDAGVSVDALLIPEGTIPVTRWLGKYLDNVEAAVLPLKVFYKQPCFRNELLSSVCETKRRQFNQFGMEILGSDCLSSDVEVIYLIKRLLTEVGVKASQVRVRISNVGIFIRLVSECGITHEDSINLKEAMDTIAECRAGKDPGRKRASEEKFNKGLSKYSLSEVQRNMWSVIWNHDAGTITPEMFTTFPSGYKKDLDQLEMICNDLKKNDVNAVLDLCVVRSHEYYTGISFEVDVVTEENQFIEIAGGGRYDKLVGNFVANSKYDTIPSTGFAFGLERVSAMLESMGKFDKTVSFGSSISFDGSNADVVLVLSNTGDSVSQYFSAVDIIENNKNCRYDVYFGSDQDVKRYQLQRGAKEIVNVPEI